jgi:hypothetical protein
LDGFTPGLRVRNHSRFPGVVFRFLSPPFREFYRTRVLTVASRSCNRFCFLDSLDLAPIMGRRLGSAGPAVSEREEELIGLAILSIAATATLHDTDETKCSGFSDSWRNGVVVDSVCLEILKSYRQPAVVVAAVMRKLDLDPVDNASSRKRKGAPRWAFYHLDHVCSKLATDSVATFDEAWLSFGVVVLATHNEPQMN